MNKIIVANPRSQGNRIWVPRQPVHSSSCLRHYWTRRGKVKFLIKGFVTFLSTHLLRWKLVLRECIINVFRSFIQRMNRGIECNMYIHVLSWRAWNGWHGMSFSSVIYIYIYNPQIHYDSTVIYIFTHIYIYSIYPAGSLLTGYVSSLEGRCFVEYMSQYIHYALILAMVFLLSPSEGCFGSWRSGSETGRGSAIAHQCCWLCRSQGPFHLCHGFVWSEVLGHSRSSHR